VSIVLSDMEVERRKPVWTAISHLFLDTEISDGGIRNTASVLASSGYGQAELDRIYLYEVVPVVGSNLLSVAGEWAGFDETWLHEQILKSIQNRTRLQTWWFGTWPYRKMMTYATDEDWKKVLDLVRSGVYEL